MRSLVLLAMVALTGCTPPPEPKTRAEVEPIVVDALCGSEEDKGLALARLTELPDENYDTVSELADEIIASGCPV